MPDCPDNGPYPWEKTPILRADALDDDLDLEYESVTPKYATGGIVNKVEDATDAVPFILQPGTLIFEPYENGQGGWSYRRVVVR